MSRRIKVLMMPDYREGNPFQHLLEQSLSGYGVDVVFNKGYKRVLPIFREVRKHPGLDLLHLHWITPYLKGKSSFAVGLYALKFISDVILTRLSGMRIVWTIHNQVSHDTAHPEIEIFTYRILSKLVNAAILHGHSLKENIKDYRIDERKLSIINLGNYKDVYPPLIDKEVARLRLLIPAVVKKVYLHQGLLKPYKGIEDLIEVWKGNAHKLKDHSLFIVGKCATESYESTIKEMIGGDKTINLIPRYVTDEEITTLYSACDVVVLPFRRIMASSSLMVAISFGKPVIAPKLGASEELLGNASDLLYESNGGSKALSAAIMQSVEQDLESLGARTQARADLFDWGEIGNKTSALYRKFTHE